jgi:hypothetical protein
MANDNLTSQTIASTYNQLLITADTGGITGSGSSATQIHCGAATAGAGNADTTALYLSTTRVGIGTTAPDGLLEIKGTGHPTQMFRIQTDGGGGMAIGADDDADNPVWQFSTNSSEDLEFKPGATAAALYLKSDGNVGIGTTTPQTELHVDSAATATAIALTYSKASGNIANDDHLGVIYLGGKDDGQTLAEAHGAAKIAALAEDAWDGSNRGTQLQFTTTTGETSSVAMTIDKAGNVGIGATAPATALEISQTSYPTIRLTGQYPGIQFSETNTTDENWWIYNNSGDLTFEGQNDAFGSASKKVTILASGYVGIGTASPATLLHLQSTGATVIRLQTDGGDNTGLQFYDNTTQVGQIGWHESDGCIKITHGTTFDNDSICLSAAGYVGIGTASPNKNTTTIGNETVLEIRGGDGTDTGFGCAGALYLTSAQDAVVDGNVLGYIGFIGTEDDSGGDAILPGAAIWAEAEGTYDTTGNETALCFSTATSSTAVATANERMRIDKNGNVGIGVTDPDSALEVHSAGIPLHLYRSSATATHYLAKLASDVGGTETLVWRVEADGDTISSTGSYTSDERVKKNIATISGALSKVNALRGITFEWKYAGKDGTKYGLISQEVEQVIPELVRDDGLDAPRELKDDGVEQIKSLNYTGLIPVLIEAVKELSAKVTALENA